MNKTELDFSLILNNTICDQCNRKMLTKMVYILIYLFFRSWPCSNKNKEQGKKRRKSNDEINEELLKSLIDGEIVENEELNLRSDNVRNFEDTIPVV